MGRSEGKNKKLATALLSGSSLNIKGSGQRSWRKEFEDTLSRLEALRQTAIANKRVSSKPEAIILKSRDLTKADLSALNLGESEFKNVNFDQAVFSYEKPIDLIPAVFKQGSWKFSTLFSNSIFSPSCTSCTLHFTLHFFTSPTSHFFCTAINNQSYYAERNRYWYHEWQNSRESSSEWIYLQLLLINDIYCYHPRKWWCTSNQQEAG